MKQNVSAAPHSNTDARGIQAKMQRQPNFEILQRGQHPLRSAKVDSYSSSTNTIGADESVTLNFVSTDIREVAKAVLGDLLGLNYEISGKVQGTITIQSSQPLAGDEILPALEQALALNNLVLYPEGGLWKVTTREEAPKSLPLSALTDANSRSRPGYGVEIVPLKYVSVAEMVRLLTPITPADDMLTTDTTRNLLFIRGTHTERAALLENISLFDVDWLAGKSFALYTPQYVGASELIQDIEDALGGAGSPIGDLIRLVPIDRLNAILFISSQEAYLRDLGHWAARLDRPGEGESRRIFVYNVQNGRAIDLSAVLIDVLSTQKGSGSNVRPRSPARPGVENSIGGVSLDGLGEINITADETNNALVILATPREYEIVSAALAQLDIEPLQVLLEAVIAEVTLTDEIRYGIQYFYQSEDRQQFVLSSASTSAIAPGLPGFAYTFTQGTDIRVTLDAISEITTVNVLSSPQILVLNNQTATLQVGNRVPIVTEQAVSTLTSDASVVNSVQYQDTGVILTVTPRVNQGGLVTMDISQEVSEVTSTTTSDIDSPTILQRKIETTVAVQDNETIALGGLISSNRGHGRSGVPGLQSIPGLGALFRSTSNSNTRTELMVLITPHVVNNVEKARAVTEELRRKLPNVQPILENHFE